MTATAGEPLIGVINAGSSSLKFSFYEGERRLLTGQVDGLGARPSASATGPEGETIAPPDLGAAPPSTPSEVLPAVLPWARERLGARRLAALGHRVVHGGLRHSRPARVTPELLAELEALVPLAPLHEPHNLAPIKMALSLNPDLPQVACFDTAFHRTAPEVEQAFALPYAFYEEGVRRYGFHGLSYEYIASVLPQHAPGDCGRPDRRAASRQWLLGLRTQGPHLDRDDDGFHGPRRPADGHPLRRARCGCRAAPDPAEGDVGGSARRSLLPPVRHARALRHFLGFPRAVGQRQPAGSLCGRSVLLSRCQPYRFARSRARRSRRHCLHRGRRRERRTGAKRHLPGVRLARGWSWTRRPTGSTRRASARQRAASAPYVIQTDENLMIARHARALVGS